MSPWLVFSAVTRAQARKQAQDVDLSDSVVASALAKDRLPPVGDKEDCAAGLAKYESGGDPVAARVLPLTREVLISSQSGDVFLSDEVFCSSGGCQ